MSEHRLDEILIERPRGGMRRSSRRLPGVKRRLERLTREAAEDGLLNPYRIKVRNRTKYLSDHLGPMRRLLRSQLGQPWDQVYSKICREVKGNTMAGQHVLGHLWAYVCTAVEMVDGVPHARGGAVWHSPFQPLGGWRYDDFYVHPETGLLCLADHRKQSKLPLSGNDRIVVSAWIDYRCIQGIWYEVTFAQLSCAPLVSSTQSLTRQYDVLLKREIDPGLAQQTYGRQVYAQCKRQCNKKTLKQIRRQLAENKKGGCDDHIPLFYSVLI